MGQANEHVRATRVMEMSRSASGRWHWRHAGLIIIGAWLMAGIIASTAAAATPTSSAQISTFAGGSQPGPSPATSVGIGAWAWPRPAGTCSSPTSTAMSFAR
jgi:hypothetical protein